MKKILKRLIFINFLIKIKSFYSWQNSAFSSPSPHFIKQAVLLRNAICDSLWVETGTFLGDTTDVLARNANKVYTIEPAEEFYLLAINRFKNIHNVEVIKGTSEEVFPLLLPTISGNINFWLDGHFSAGATYHGENDTPVLVELANIEKYFSNFDRFVIFIDDVRCFNSSNPSFSQYPPLNTLVEWANKHNLIWTIEHDILIIKNFN